MNGDDSAISRALNAFQALLRSRPTVNPTADREIIAAARAELAQLQARSITSGRQDLHKRAKADGLST